jgi:hypothetical protein
MKTQHIRRWLLTADASAHSVKWPYFTYLLIDETFRCQNDSLAWHLAMSLS